MNDFSEILSQLPQEAGIYKFFDANDTIIYVGKAKNLKNRVSSYFVGLQNHSRKTQRLVSQIQRIEYVVVNSELDALLLENALIKEFQPKYNILLKDDKTYPYICITHEPFPRVISTRRFEREKGTYFGPYANVRAINDLLELIRKLYTIRTCSYHLSQENITQRKFKACLEFHIQNCKAPCEGLQSEANYLEDIEQIKKILKGNIKAVREKLEQEMYAYATELAFEKAQACKEKIELLQIFQEKSQVVNPHITDVMVLTVATDEESAFINFLDVGIALIVIEVLFIPGTTFVGLLGFLLMAVGVWYAFSEYGSKVGILTASGSIVFLVFIFYWGYKKKVWRKFALNTENDAKIIPTAVSYLQVGQEGFTISALRPSGIAEFDGKRTEVQTFGELIDAGKKVKIIEIRGNEVFVSIA